MDTKTVKTPSGYTATIKTSLTYGEYLEIQEVIASGVKMKPGDSIGDIDMSVAYKANRKAIEILVTKLTDKDGNEVPVLSMFNLPVADGEVIADEVNKIRTALEPSKKK